ncbi:uncharacterized protein LOC143427214 [Xylocopa sonorina]|uniref:uncharacterized protein LOC143427214 n=1 Tax=Xylocopa sonorina TaxID=1818115 RepID=UPI00403B05E1
MSSFEKSKDTDVLLFCNNIRFSFKYKYLAFQENIKEMFNELCNTHYTVLRTYLTTFGINPYQDDKINNILIVVTLIMCASVYCPMGIKVYDTMKEKDYDGIFEDLPQALIAILSIVKLLNIRVNKIRVCMYVYCKQKLLRYRKL